MRKESFQGEEQLLRTDRVCIVTLAHVFLNIWHITNNLPAFALASTTHREDMTKGEIVLGA